MYKLLVVDDEPTVRFGLRSYMNWSQFGIEYIGDADDGDTGLEAVELLKPDIVLTDVRMPNMDGITLSKEIRKRFPHIKIVFVSGHDDSDYLKSAMKVSAVDYIFKPVNLQELRTVIERVVAELDAEHSERRLTEEMQAKLKVSMPLLREKFLMSLVREARTGASERLFNRLEFLGLELPADGTYWVIAVTVDRLAEVRESRSERDMQLLSYSVLNVCQELADRFMKGMFFEHRDGEFVGIVHSNPDSPEALSADDMSAAPGDPNPVDQEERLFALASDIRDNLQRWLKISVTIGIGDRTAITGLAVSYAQAREAADRKWYLGQNQIISMDSLAMEGAVSAEPPLYRFDQEERSRLTSVLKGADPEQLQAALDPLFAQFTPKHKDGMKLARNIILQIVLSAGQLLLELNLQSKELEEKEAQLWEQLFLRETLGEMRVLLEAYLADVIRSIRDRRSGRANNLVERVRAVIERRYSDNDLTVAEIGKEVFLTDTYVSLLFKQETGKTVNEFLTQYRVDKAKELLLDPSQKFYDICYAVGYADPSYFSKLFKKTTGLTPSAYRDSLPTGK